MTVFLIEPLRSHVQGRKEKPFLTVETVSVVTELHMFSDVTWHWLREPGAKSQGNQCTWPLRKARQGSFLLSVWVWQVTFEIARRWYFGLGNKHIFKVLGCSCWLAHPGLIKELSTTLTLSSYLPLRCRFALETLVSTNCRGFSLSLGNGGL